MFRFLNDKTIAGVKRLADFDKLLQSHSVWCEVLPEGESKRVLAVGRKYVRVNIKGHPTNIDPKRITGFRW